MASLGLYDIGIEMSAPFRENGKWVHTSASGLRGEGKTPIRAKADLIHQEQERIQKLAISAGLQAIIDDPQSFDLTSITPIQAPHKHQDTTHIPIEGPDGEQRMLKITTRHTLYQ